jgi:hypothetical protein
MDAVLAHIRETQPEGTTTSTAGDLDQATSSDTCLDMAKYIYGHQDENHYSGDNPDTAIKLFATLVNIEQESAISDFIKYGIKDKHLPLQKTEQQGTNFCLALKTEKGSESVLKKWEQPTATSFEHSQWAVLAPILQPQKNMKFNRYELESKIVLPFSEAELMDANQNSQVWKVTIDKEHHRFGKACLQAWDLARDPSFSELN